MQSDRQSPNKPNNHIPLDFESVQDLPDSHSWTQLDHYYYNPSTDVISNVESSVPVIDLSESNAANLISRACETWGVFHVLNHGIPMQLVKEVELQARLLFSLPTQQKLETVRPTDGMTGYGLPRVSNFYGKLMWTEGFTIVGSPVEHARKLWPDDYINFCDVMEEYQKKMKELSKRLMWLMLEPLGVTKDDVEWMGPTGEIEDAINPLQLNSYPVCPDPERAMGLADHTDTSILTVLHQSSSGLQVLRDGAGWVMVPPVDGALVVNVGDLLHNITNGRFVSLVHRAILSQADHRLSIAYFFAPPMDVQISPLKKLVDDDHPPIYRPVTWREFLAIKKKHFNKAHEMIRIAEVK